MSIRVMTRVWDQASAAGGELLVLLALADFADDEGYCYPKEQQIAEKARLSDRQVRTVIKALSARGELAYQTGRGRNARSWYVVLSGLPDDIRATRIVGLDVRQNRKKLPEISSAQKLTNRKKLPEETSAFPEKTGSLTQLKPEVYDISTGDFAQSDGSNGFPNRHEIRHDPPPPCVEEPENAAGAAGGGGESEPVPTPNPETRRALLAAGVKSTRALRRLSPLAPDLVRRARRYLGADVSPGVLVGFLDDRIAHPDEPWPDCPTPTPRSAAPPPLPAVAPLDPARRAELVAAARNGLRQELRQ